jgi:RNA polymerase sigma-70 factor (ECF subfamily)
MDSDSDEALVDRVAAGDATAYRQLVDRHLARTLRLARRLTGNASDAEDVTQDAFLRLWQHGHRWQPGRARFTTWFYRIVVNLCIDRRRRPAFAPLEAAGDPADDRPDAETEIDRELAARAVAQALAGLPERQRAALVLSYYEGLSNAETAKILAISVGAVETLLVRARRNLRERLAAFAKEGL